METDRREEAEQAVEDVVELQLVHRMAPPSSWVGESCCSREADIADWIEAACAHLEKVGQHAAAAAGLLQEEEAAKSEPEGAEDRQVHLEGLAINAQLERARFQFYKLDDDGNGVLNGEELHELVAWVFASFAKAVGKRISTDLTQVSNSHPASTFSSAQLYVCVCVCVCVCVSLCLPWHGFQETLL